MYKTVRQGENSLQYTILPQTEEVLSNSGMKGKGRDYSPSIHVRRSKDRTCAAKALIVAYCIVMAMTTIGTIWFLNYYGMLGPGPGPQSAEADRAASYALRHFPSSVSVGVSTPHDDGAKSRKKELRMSEVPPTLRVDSDTTTTIADTTTATGPPTTSTATTTDKRTKPAWSMPAFKQFYKSSSTSPSTAPPPPPPPAPIVEDQDELNIPNGPFSRSRITNRDGRDGDDVTMRPIATTDSTTGAPRKQMHITTRVQATYTYLPNPTDDHERDTTQDTLLASTWGFVVAQASPKHGSDDREEHKGQEVHDNPSDNTYPAGKDLKDVKESILDDEEEFKELEINGVFSFPPLKKEVLEKGRPGWMEAEDDVTVTKTSSPKLRNMWPFEPSLSLFQWPDYSQEDSMVIPLLVGTATLLTVALVLTAVVVRRRRDQARGASHIGKLTADLQADDNTNLLTAESQEEE